MKCIPTSHTNGQVAKIRGKAYFPVLVATSRTVAVAVAATETMPLMITYDFTVEEIEWWRRLAKRRQVAINIGCIEPNLAKHPHVLDYASRCERCYRQITYLKRHYHWQL